MYWVIVKNVQGKIVKKCSYPTYATTERTIDFYKKFGFVNNDSDRVYDTDNYTFTIETCNRVSIV